MIVSSSEAQIFEAVSPSLTSVMKEGATLSDGTVVLPPTIGFDSLTDAQIETVIGAYRAGLMASIISQNPNWQPLALQNGAIADDDYFPPVVGVVGSKVWLRGGVSVGQNVSFAVLPEGARPQKIVRLAIAEGGSLIVNPSGSLVSTADNPSLDGLSFWVE